MRKTLYLRKVIYVLIIQSKGGACIMNTRDWILIGTFNTENKMENGANQNEGELNKRVAALAADFISKE